MSTNIPDGAAGPLASVVSGIANSVAGANGGSGDTAAGQVAGDMVREVASGIDQIFKTVFGSLQKHPASGAVLQPPAFSANGTDEAALSVEISALKSQIDGMKREASRLMHSGNKFDQLRGQNELEVAVELFGLLSKMLELQMQIKTQLINGVPR
jgi:hypothetical protein